MKLVVAFFMKFLTTVRTFALKHQTLADRLTLIASLSTFIFVVSWELPEPPGHVVAVAFFVHELVWLLYLTYVVAYFDLSNPLKFIREHIPELVIAATWYPHAYQLSVGSLLIPYSVFHLTGVSAHAWILSRCGRQRWGDHPFFATNLCALTFILFSSALVREVEPTSFKDFPTAIYFILETLSTVGYGDLVPKSDGGKLVAVLAMFFGTGLFSAFNGFVTEWIHHLVTEKKTHASEVDMLLLAEDVKEVKELMREVQQQQAEILRRLEQANLDKTS